MISKYNYSSRFQYKSEGTVPQKVRKPWLVTYFIISTRVAPAYRRLIRSVNIQYHAIFYSCCCDIFEIRWRQFFCVNPLSKLEVQGPCTGQGVRRHCPQEVRKLWRVTYFIHFYYSFRLLQIRRHCQMCGGHKHFKSIKSDVSLTSWFLL